MLHFTIPGNPVPQPRQRHALIGGFIRNYTPAKHEVHAFKQAARIVASNAWGRACMSGPLSLKVVFVMPRAQKEKSADRRPHAIRPDLDNLLKALQDALKEVVWVDDSQVCHVEAYKMVAAEGEKPHTEVWIEELP